MKTKTIYLIIAFGIFILFIIIIFMIYLSSNTQIHNDNTPSPSSDNKKEDILITSQPSPTVIVIEPPDEFQNHEKRDAQEKKENPRLFLYNVLPHETDTFRFDGELISLSPEEYIFTVTVKTRVLEAREDMYTWLLSIGLTKDQVQELEEEIIFEIYDE